MNFPSLSSCGQSWFLNVFRLNKESLSKMDLHLIFVTRDWNFSSCIKYIISLWKQVSTWNLSHDLYMGWLIPYADDSLWGCMQIFPGKAVFLISNDWNSDDSKIFWIIGKKFICPSALFKIFKDSMTSQSDFSFFRFSDFSSFWRSFANKSESLIGFSNCFWLNAHLRQLFS